MNSQCNFYPKLKAHEYFEKERCTRDSSPSTLMQLIDEKFSGKKSKPLCNVNSFVNNFNSQTSACYDIESLRDGLQKAKCELNKRNKELNSLKIAYMKLESENKSNLKIIEDILQEANKKGIEEGNPLMDNDELNTNITNMTRTGNFSLSSLNKLKETYIATKLKRQVSEYKQLLNVRDDEIAQLKSNSKVAKLQDMEIKLSTALEDLNIMSVKYNQIKLSLADHELKAKEILDERDYYKALTARIKTQFDTYEEKVRILQEQNTKLSEVNTVLEEKSNSSKFQHNVVKYQIKEKDNEIEALKEKVKNLEEFKNEKEKYDKNASASSKIIKSFKEDIEKKNKKIKELEKINSDHLSKIEESEKEKMKITTALNKHSKSQDNSTRIKSLELENAGLKNEIKALKDGNCLVKKELCDLSATVKENNHQEVNNMGPQEKIETLEKKEKIITVKNEVGNNAEEEEYGFDYVKEDDINNTNQ